jgi:hypothetical protein
MSTGTGTAGGLNYRPSAGKAKARRGRPGSGEQGESTVAAACSDKSQPILIVNITEAFGPGFGLQ